MKSYKRQSNRKCLIVVYFIRLLSVVNVVDVFLKVLSPGGLVAAQLTLMSHLLVQTILMLPQVVGSHTLILTLRAFQLLEAVVVFLLEM